MNSAARLPGSVLLRWSSEMCRGVLRCERCTELNVTLLVVQTILPAMSHLCQVHTINTKTRCNLALGVALMFQRRVEDSSQTPRHPPHTPPPSPPHASLAKSCLCFLQFQLPPLYLPSSIRGAGLSNYQRLACGLVTLD